jgi:octaprenyl-diphosphate synthase
MTIKEISRPVVSYMDDFDKYFRNVLKSDVSLLNIILNYVASKKGKRVRPMLVFLSAEISGGINDRTFTGAAMSELLHIATLIHDDVVDEAKERRGLPSVNAIWKNKISVLIGDFLLAKGLLTSINHSEFDFLRVTSQTVQRMSEGELLQIQKSRRIDIDEDTYYRIIADKTASLISSCCEIGAISGTDDLNYQAHMAKYGEYLGMAYQIRDDIFDIKSSAKLIGKPVGNDLKEKKITLPLIYSFTRSGKAETKEIVRLIKAGNLKKKDIKQIKEFIELHGGVDYAENKAREFAFMAVGQLDIFPDCEAKESLINLANFVVTREN